MLTELLDRDAMEATIAGRLAGNAETPVPLALVELGGLTILNDEQGRRAGDAVLSGLARRLERLFRAEFGPDAQVFRVDGARFALLPPPGTPAARLRVESRAIIGGLGDVLATRPGSELALRLADGVVGADDIISSAVGAVARRLSAPPALMRWHDLEEAARGDGLMVLFQPQFSLPEDRLVGAEALVRWRHPRLGEVSGALLFAAAQPAGMETRLSRAVWRCALDQMALWPDELSQLRVALNITAADLAEKDTAATLIAMARDAGVDCRRLTVEVTEAALIRHLDGAAATLGELRDAGFLAALDDFGTGYSGLAWLKRLPVDYIKIDGHFARDIEASQRAQAVLRGVVDLAAAIDLGVLAEGVESVEQRDQLAALGCRWYQGFLRAPALPDDAFCALALAERRDGAG